MKNKRKTTGVTAIVKPTHDCNLDCMYCYVEESAERGNMNVTTLTNTIEKIVKYNGLEKASDFIWHGGEPLIIGIEFFKRIIEIQKALGESYEIHNGIQTNGTLLDEKIADFFTENKFHIGLSLDGSKEFQDYTRKYKDGSSTFEKVINAVKLIKERKIGGGVITVITKKNIDYLKELYYFFRENDINVKFNPLIRSGNAVKNLSALEISPIEYGTAMIELFDIWFNDKEKDIRIDPFEAIVGNMITGIPFGCNYSGHCQENFMSIGPKGDIYPCGRFDGNPRFYLGNINTNSIEEIEKSETRRLLKDRANKMMDKCSPCDYFKICNSGCPHDALIATGNINSKTPYCVGYKLLFSHIEKRLNEEVRKSNEVRCSQNG